MQICHTGFADCLLASCQHTLYDIYDLLCVQCWNPDDRQKNSPKHEELYSKNTFGKLVHLLGFIIRIYHDARYIVCQIVENIRELYNQVRLQNFSEGLYH